MQDRLRASVDVAGYRVDARTETHSLVFDLPPPQGQGAGPTPTEGLLSALAACTAMDVAAILRKKRQAADRYQVEVSGERAPDHPRVFTRIVVEHQVWGDVEREALRRAVELSSTRYCPVNAMLAGVVEIEHRYRLVLGEGDEQSAVVSVIGPGR
jgi:putative redox protein